MTTTQPTAAELEQQLAAARSSEQQRIEAEMARRDAAEVAFAHERGAEYDRDALNADVRHARGALRAALAGSPVFAALAQLHVAEVRRNRAGHAHAMDLNTLARAAGQPATAMYEGSNLTTLSAELLIREVYDLAQAQATEEDQAENVRHQAAIAVDLTDQQIETVERVRDLERRRAEVVEHSVNVEGMTETERRAAQLPPGKSYPNEGGFRGVLDS